MNSPLTSLPLPRWQERVARAFSRAAPRYDDLASAQRDIGEALWQTGNQEQARSIWREGFEQDPDHPILTETVERLTGEPSL